MSRRLLVCVENWPECETGTYDPRCCRFPKSCSCTIYSDDIDPSLLEPAPSDIAHLRTDAGGALRPLSARARPLAGAAEAGVVSVGGESERYRPEDDWCVDCDEHGVVIHDECRRRIEAAESEARV